MRRSGPTAPTRTLAWRCPANIRKSTITHTRGWNFPDKTVLVKSFALETRKATRSAWVETRFLTKQDGEWYGYSYKWNDAQTDGELVAASGLDREFIGGRRGMRKQTWHFPSRAECMVCHSRAANFVLGPSEAQFNREHDYSGVKDNQLRVLEHLGLLKADSKLDPGKLHHLADPYDKSQDLEARARSYLHANCAHCHVEAGGGNAQMNLEFNTAKDAMKIFDVKPVHHTFGIADARLIAPGHPEHP